jgi:hypothetical protein
LLEFVYVLAELRRTIMIAELQILLLSWRRRFTSTAWRLADHGF